MVGCAAYPFWVTRVKTLGEWYASCIYLGFVGSPFFVLPTLSLSDTVGFTLIGCVRLPQFFYHERGLPLGIFVAATYGGALGVSMLSGWVWT